MALVSVTEFAQRHGQDPGRVRRLILDGRIPAQKIGKQWAIEETVPWPEDARVSTGRYRGWRRQTQHNGGA